MTAKERWQTWTGNADPPSAAALQEDFPAFVDELLADTAQSPAFARIRALPRTQLKGFLKALQAGSVVPLGTAPQLEIALLAALQHAARGRRVLLFSGMPAAASLTRSLMQELRDTIGVDIRASGHLFAHPNVPFQKVLDAEIVMCDYIQVLDALQRNREVFSDRGTACLGCEIDLCLYDARLAIFDGGSLKAVGCIYRSSGKKPWKDHGNTLDFAEAATAFHSLAGVTSYLTPRLRNELRRCYGEVFDGSIRARQGGGFSAFAFRKAATKMEWLCRDVNLAEGDCLVFYADDRLRQQLQKALRQRGQETTALSSSGDLETFLAMSGESGKRVGLFAGLPSLLRPPVDHRPPMRVFLGQHYLLAHQHQKLGAFLDAAVALQSRPVVYFSLEDDLFSIYADEDSFQGAFDLIEFTEKYDRRRRVRRVMAQSILRKIHRLRQSCLDEEFPILTVVNQARVRKATGVGRGKGGPKRGRIGRQLEGLCFCGSGKPFRECHGKPRS